MTKGDVSSAITIAFSVLGAWLSKLNIVIAEFMPLITAFGILAGTVLTWWYYSQQIKQKIRDRDLMKEQIAYNRRSTDE